jgi:hypothetical protein
VFEIGASGEATFKIVQMNQFKASDHLKLKFKKGNDESIKKYLSSKLKLTKDTLIDLEQKQGALEQAHQKVLETNEQLMFDTNQLREENRRVVD